ncbi:hypothetical protein EYF80_050287 [Liparis tanakae]|uniref:Uncharacterized protein n=1 Tax=Liparis tanakae TaxID=230148 RepID=A0A4Z2FF79_9TELE|nr:hypothetical protein EYF80_050287 [Liparis tanakae]
MLCSTALSRPSLRLARSNISRSYEFLVMRRYTFTALFWPIRAAFLSRLHINWDKLANRCTALHLPAPPCTSLHRPAPPAQLIRTCKSFCGFQSESKMMQVSAAVRLMPRPPALVHRRKTKRSESGLLKRSMAACRRFPRTRPSIRSYKYLRQKEDRASQ